MFGKVRAKGFSMKTLLAIALLCLSCAVCAAQEKGVDQQNDRIRDSSTNRQPAVNGSKVDTGVGRGMDFGKGKTQPAPPVPNPYRFQAPNDVLTKAAQELMRERKLIIDDTVSKPETGLLVYALLLRGADRTGEREKRDCEKRFHGKPLCPDPAKKFKRETPASIKQRTV